MHVPHRRVGHGRATHAHRERHVEHRRATTQPDPLIRRSVEHYRATQSLRGRNPRKCGAGPLHTPREPCGITHVWSDNAPHTTPPPVYHARVEQARSTRALPRPCVEHRHMEHRHMEHHHMEHRHMEHPQGARCHPESSNGGVRTAPTLPGSSCGFGTSHYSRDQLRHRDEHPGHRQEPQGNHPTRIPPIRTPQVPHAHAPPTHQRQYREERHNQAKYHPLRQIKRRIRHRTGHAPDHEPHRI
ncbi:hypothetical protein Uis4E_1415 [Bifidobacterium parmae]|uniref:Uncharacterized protein n=1 Tax=Bifidobacterium parmae TaxID=361854 RepID=A0A2N5J0I1_9BIFI|nr:hypothetical protein Uis4E_1415 [Bifidobacterium parmae]